VPSQVWIRPAKPVVQALQVRVPRVLRGFLLVVSLSKRRPRVVHNANLTRERVPEVRPVALPSKALAQRNRKRAGGTEPALRDDVDDRARRREGCGPKRIQRPCSPRRSRHPVAPRHPRVTVGLERVRKRERRRACPLPPRGFTERTGGGGEGGKRKGPESENVSSKVKMRK